MAVPVKNYSDFTAHQTTRSQLRDKVRNGAVFMLSLGRSINRTSGWIRFPYYHHVFDDERVGFVRQLGYLRQFGDFISLGDAVEMLESGSPIDGRYFCITFDDGFRNNMTNAVPILVDKNIPAAFFLATDYIDRYVEADHEHLLGFFDHGQVLMEFLTWDDCRKMIEAGMEIGSHTVHHARLSDLDEAGVMDELRQSQTMIETNTGQRCEHFCSPFGIPDLDFRTERDPGLAKAVGYRSMSTTERGPMLAASDPYRIRRDHTLANWDNHQLLYFLSQE